MVRIAALVAPALLLGGCVTVKTPPPPADAPKVCNARPAQTLLGAKASSDTGARALELSGAATLRWGAPGSVWTMDYREDRVNVRFNASNAITEITCG